MFKTNPNQWLNQTLQPLFKKIKVGYHAIKGDGKWYLVTPKMRRYMILEDSKLLKIKTQITFDLKLIPDNHPNVILELENNRKAASEVGE